MASTSRSICRGAATHPITLTVPNRVVYAAHDYVFAHHPSDYSSYAQVPNPSGPCGGAISIGGAHPAPVWVNEFGTLATTSSDIVSTTPSTTGYWFSALIDYLKRGSFDWAVWPINGTYGYSTRQVHTSGSTDPHGVLASNWSSLRTDEAGQPLLYHTFSNCSDAIPALGSGVAPPESAVDQASGAPWPARRSGGHGASGQRR